MEQEKAEEKLSIARVYYAHGLMCASYPATALVIVAAVVIICSLPFFITTSGDVNSPKPWRSPWLNYRVPLVRGANEPDGEWIINNASLMSVRTPQWFLGFPQTIIHQIFVHVEVDCSQLDSLCQSSYYRLSKTTSALMLDSLQQADKSCRSVLHPAVVKFARHLSNKDTPPVSFSSFLLSPLLDSMYHETDKSEQLNLLKQNLSLQTIKELLYGGFWEESHLKQQEMPGALSSHRFAVSFLLKPTIENFPQLLNCVETLESLWPVQRPGQTFMKHFYYESEWSLSDFAPLLCLYSIVFLYITFSVGKIDLVRSKFGLGFTAVITVISSLTMSLGICTFFGLSITVSGSEIFPFVVVVIGLENILIITKAVISTDPGLEVKNRIAEGLSKEGKALLYNLLTVICLVILGIFTFNYAMKEFCTIALVGILCDYFLQMVFFTTVLSIDIKRMELSDLKLSHHGNQSANSSSCDSLQVEKGWRIPRRDKVNNFIVRGRYAQKFVMVVLLAYMGSVFYRTDTFHMLLRTFTNSTSSPSPSPSVVPTHLIPSPAAPVVGSPVLSQTDYGSHVVDGEGAAATGDADINSYIKSWSEDRLKEEAILYRSDEDGFSLWCGEESYCWRPMVTTHWPHLFQFYNVTLKSKFITVLPPVMLNYRLGFSPQALFGRTRDDKSLIQTLHNVLLELFSIPNVLRGLFLLVIGVIVLAYLVYLWIEAISLAKSSKKKQSPQLVRVIRLPGDGKDIECLSIDGGLAVTVGTDSVIHIWDISLRQRTLTIDRKEMIDLVLQRDRDMMSRYIVGCEDPPDIISSSSSSAQQTIATPPAAPPATAAAVAAQVTNTITSHPCSSVDSPSTHFIGTPPSIHLSLTGSSQTAPPTTPPITPPTASPTALSLSRPVTLLPSKTPPTTPPVTPPIAPPTAPSLTIPVTLPSSKAPPTSLPTSIAPTTSSPLLSTMGGSIPQKILPNFFLRRFSMPTFRKSPDNKRDPLLISPFPNVESIPEHPPASVAIPVLVPPATSLSLLSPSCSSPPVSPNIPPVHHSIASCSTVQDSTNSVSMYSKPLSSTHEVATSLTHKRSHSGSALYRSPHYETVSLGSQWSVESISVLSENASELSYETANMVPFSPGAAAFVQGGDLSSSSSCFQFKQHFSLFSQFTSNLALEHCEEKTLESDEGTPSPPSTWCMDTLNGTIAVGCGNGQVEVWNNLTGSLKFFLVPQSSGVTVIKVHPIGIISGHMDGSLHLIGHHGHMMHSVSAHSKPISTLCYSNDYVITGGYDTIVKVFRINDFICLRSLSRHPGHITSLISVGSHFCVSGCSTGVVCYWNIASGQLLQELTPNKEEAGTATCTTAAGVVRVCCSEEHVIGLLRDSSVRVWNKETGHLSNIIEMGGYAHDISLIDSNHIAIALQSAIVIYNVQSRREVSRKQLEATLHTPVIRHLYSLESSTLICSSGSDLQLVPSGLKIKSD